jgi:hypothetical protein
MAKLSRFKQDHKAITEGEWITLEEFDGLEIFTRGYNDDYEDARSRKQRQAAVSMGGNVDRLPIAIKRKINVECLIAHVVRDVRNLTDDDGRPVPFPEFCDLLRDPDFYDLVVACYAAAAQVGQRRQFDLEEAVSPLSQGSPTSLNGAGIGHS